MAFAKEALTEIGDPLRAAGVLEQRGRLKIRLGHRTALDDLREAARLVPVEPPSVTRARVLSKLNVTSRGEAAATAHRLRLT